MEMNDADAGMDRLAGMGMTGMKGKERKEKERVNSDLLQSPLLGSNWHHSFT